MLLCLAEKPQGDLAPCPFPSQKELAPLPISFFHVDNSSCGGQGSSPSVHDLVCVCVCVCARVRACSLLGTCKLDLYPQPSWAGG